MASARTPAQQAVSFENFSLDIARRPLRPYQLAPAQAILQSVHENRGDTFVVMMARQMGKNELSAQLEAYLLSAASHTGGSIVKTAPTFRPQLHTSIARLDRILRHPAFDGQYSREFGYRSVLGDAEAVFLSGGPYANVAGATASLLLEIDEGQDIDFDKYTRDFRPMAASTNATTVIYGTAWTADTLLERQRDVNARLERSDGIQRNFIYPWQVGAEHNPQYARFVQSEIDRLGAAHPLILTQYELEPIDTAGGLFDRDALTLMKGHHQRAATPASESSPNRYYVAGIDLAGAAISTQSQPTPTPRDRDSTVITIAEVTDASAPDRPPAIRILDITSFHNVPLHIQQERIHEIFSRTWPAARIAIDSTGIGADIATRLQQSLGPSRVEPITFTVASKTRLAYTLLTAVTQGTLQMWHEDTTPQSAEYAEFWRQITRVKPITRAGNNLGFEAPRSQHDDYVTSLALCAWAARQTPATDARALLRGNYAAPTILRQQRPDGSRF